MAIDVAVPLVSAKYTGPFPHPGTDIDDGTYHTSFSDVRFAVRYNLVREGAVITPYIGSVVPSNNYAYYGHSAPGQQLNELQVGVYAAKLFERGLPGLFVSGRYGYGFVEKVLDISHNRSLGNLEVGYFFNSRFRAFTMANAGLTHGGDRLPVQRHGRTARRVPAVSRSDSAREPPRSGCRRRVLDDRCPRRVRVVLDASRRTEWPFDGPRNHRRTQLGFPAQIPGRVGDSDRSGE